MKTRYVSKHEIERYLEGNDLVEDLQASVSIGISSIADLIELCDMYKQNNKTGFIDQVINLKEGHLKSGVIYLSELDRYGLFLTLFENDDDEGVLLWPDASNRDISPLQSVRCLTLRVNEAVFWENDVYQDMMNLCGQ